MKTIQQWLSEYGESHQDHTNKTIHWICVPAIFFSIVGLLFSIKLPFNIAGVQLNVAMILKGGSYGTVIAGTDCLARGNGFGDGCIRNHEVISAR